MSLRSSATSYGLVARLLHWLVALLILFTATLGLRMVRLPTGSDAEATLAAGFYSLHKTVGVALFFIVLCRLVWALFDRRPAPVHPERRLETALARLVHGLLWGAMIVMPVSGWLFHAATDGFAPILWPLGQSLPFVPKSPAVAASFRAIHDLSAWLLLIAIALHVAGAAKHALLERDGTLARMTTGRPAGSDADASPTLRPILLACLVWLGLIAAALLTAPAPDQAASPATAGATIEASNWQVTDGTLTFAVGQLQAGVRGTLANWTAAIDYDPDKRSGQVTVEIPLSGMSVGSVTPQAAAAEFFDVARFPTAHFAASIADKGGQLAATGTLTLKGRTVPVTLPFALTLDGGKAHASGQVALDRRDFGIGPSYKDETTVAFAVTVAFDLTAQRR